MRPFTEDAFDDFGMRSKDLREAFEFTEEEVETLDFGRFVNESYAIAEIAFDDITEGSDQKLPDWYLEKFTPIARRRVALSGHRLAYLIKQLFGKSELKLGGSGEQPPEVQQLVSLPKDAGSQNFFLGSGAIKLVSTGLIWMISLIFISNF